MPYYPISPLKYPGGKFRALSDIIPRAPADIREYREPFAGSAPVFFELRNRNPELTCWINDLNRDLIDFYRSTQTAGRQLERDIHKLKDMYPEDGRALLDAVLNLDSSLGYHRALRFFILNRLTFNGIGLTRLHTQSKSYSELQFRKKFTHSLINRVSTASELLQGVRITNIDYSKLLTAPGKKVFIFLDPPYLLDKDNSLYGERGVLHGGFDYQKLSEDLRACPHKWLMTINDCPEIRDLFTWARLEPFSLQYSMQGPKEGKELFISNYKPKIFKNASLMEWC